MNEHTVCQKCNSRISKQDDGWAHVQTKTDHEAIPFHANEWPTENVIGPFEYNHKPLSNFYEVSVEYNGDTFPSTEHAYQAMKARNDPDLYDEILAADDPHEAKQLGRQSTLPPNWEAEKKYIMLEVVTAKFSQNEDIRAELMETGTQTLVELNWWDDTYWGADIETGEGQNMLGRILMHVRSTFRSMRL